ncbi:putative reverse transcriptase zinc-binding domain-containing protein [Helianthus annuus]|nr:putative reverse transcriptase zinc-binding domain-containing protein [Helianthus annuus]
MLLASVSLGPSTDNWSWIGGFSGDFSVKAVRNLLSTGYDTSHRFVYNWCNWIPKKINIFAWRSELNSIPTGVALRNRNVPITDVSCPLCNFGDESVDHLFTSCFVAAAVWQFISTWCKGPNIFAFSFSFKDLLELHLSAGLSEGRVSRHHYHRLLEHLEG